MSATGGPLRHAELRRDRARAVRDEFLGFLPAAAAPLLPALDAAARRWLSRTRSPYLTEIAGIAATLGFSGVWLLNGSYQWGCTALAREEDGAPWLARTLDWPFHGMGRYVDVHLLRGAGGRIFQRHLAGLCRRADGDGAGPLRRLHQPGADVAAHAPSLASPL